MGRIKDIITPFRSCRKWTTAAVLDGLGKDHATAAVPLTAGSDDDGEDVAAGAASEPHIVLKMHLHCSPCAAKIERVVMDIPGVESVYTDVEASRIGVTGMADAAAVAMSVQVRTRKPVTVVSDGRSVTTARTPREDDDQGRVRGRAMAAKVRPSVPARTAVRQPEEEIIEGRQAQEQATEWTAEVRIAGLDCGRCVSRIVQRVSRFQGVREIKLTLPDRATTRWRGSSTGVRDNTRVNQHFWTHD